MKSKVVSVVGGSSLGLDARTEKERRKRRKKDVERRKKKKRKKKS